MIIGIMGRAGSGKDLVGSMIQYLDASILYKGADSYIEDLLNRGFSPNKDYDGVSNWSIRKFAEPLKQIICIITGCSREQLEDPVFKNTPLGDDWITSGKKLTPRDLLQIIGTDFIKNELNTNVWVSALLNKYKSYYKWIITDVRFPNEVRAIKEHGGVIIKVERPCSTCGEYDNTICSNGYHSIQHESETALDSYTPDYVIKNEGSIEALLTTVGETIKHLLYD